jgi:glyceraldehyde 3-phosphate dehydrogenase
MNILLNGVGRVGKSIVRIANSFENINIIAINELNSNIDNIAYNINYDSTYGRFEDKYIVKNNSIKNSKNNIEILNYPDFTRIDFEKYNIDVVIDASGSKVDIEKLKQLPIKKLLLTHPNKNADINLIVGVNEQELQNGSNKIISTSSCNATALLPVLKIINDNFSIEYGDVTTIHPLLNHQKTLDNGCISSSDRDVACNFEFGRSATQNIIPSGTTTIDACSYILPSISEEIISSSSFRVPTATVGAINVVLKLEKDITKEKLLKIFKKFQETQTSKILLNNFEPLVSCDFAQQEYTSIIDHRFTQVKKNKLLKLVLWYDNEWGYASKVVDILNIVDKSGLD